MADATTASPSMMNAAADERIPPRRLFAFLIMVFGMFMSILDIQVVSASLQQIQAGLSASSSEVSWVQTSYLIAEVIAIPLSGFLSRAFGTRLLFAISASGFTVASFFCGFASTIEQMILWRAIQGFLGAGMIPTVFASAYTVFPRSKFHIVGPDHRPGRDAGADHRADGRRFHHRHDVVALAVLHQHRSRHRHHHRRAGCWSISTSRTSRCSSISTGGACCSWRASSARSNMCWKRARSTQWLEDTSVAVCAAICVVSAIAFFWRVLSAREPIVDLRTFTDRNFGVGCLISFCVGIGLYGLTYMYPRYLAEVRGYSPLMIGETMFVSGVAMFLTAPIVGRLMAKYDMRYLIAIGLVLFALGSYQMTWITKEYDFYELLVPQILRGIGMMLAMVPTNTIALGTLAPERVKNASGLFNLTRNLGGAVGLAVINQVLNERTDLHISRLHDRINWGNATAVETLNMFTQRLQGMGDAALMAMKQLSQIVHRQAVVMGYGDAFFMLTVFYFGLSLLVMVLKKPRGTVAGRRRALSAQLGMTRITRLSCCKSPAMHL